MCTVHRCTECTYSCRWSIRRYAHCGKLSHRAKFQLKDKFLINPKSQQMHIAFQINRVSSQIDRHHHKYLTMQCNLFISMTQCNNLVHSLKGGALSKFQKSHKTIFKRLATKAAGRGVRSATIRRGLRDDLRMSMLVFEQTLYCIEGILAHIEHPLWTVEQTFLDRSTKGRNTQAAAGFKQTSAHTCSQADKPHKWLQWHFKNLRLCFR